MMPMTINVTYVTAVNGMPMAGGTGPSGTGDMGTPAILAHAVVHVQVPGFNARVDVRTRLPAPAGTDQQDWTEIAYGKTLMTLDAVWQAKIVSFCVIRFGLDIK